MRPYACGGSRAAVAVRRLAQPVYPHLRKYPFLAALTLRAKSGHSSNPTKLATCAITSQTILKKRHNARVEIAMKGRSIEASGQVVADARHRRCELRWARWQEGKVIGRHGANVWFAGQIVSGE